MARLPEREVFPSPTVHQVIFQVRFANLFYIEQRVGDFQLKIMPRFPESELNIQSRILLAQGVAKDLAKVPLEDAGESSGTKIWVFKAPDGLTLELQINSLTLTTTTHKSYRHGPAPFRDAIAFVLEHFQATIAAPIVGRIGLRYVDHCPLPNLTNAQLDAWYSSALPTDRFAVEDCSHLALLAQARRPPYELRYREAIDYSASPPFLSLDFDAFKGSTPSTDVLTTTDALHDLIRAEYEATIKDPVIEHMRQARGGGG